MNSTHPRTRQAGQTLPLLMFFMFGLLGVSALAIDVGHWYQERQQLQASVDSAALAGASQIPAGWGAATNAAAADFGRNAQAGDSAPSIQPATLKTPGDSIQVSATRQSSTFFAHIFGMSVVTLHASARATVESYTTFHSTGNLMPWGVVQQPWVPGASYQIYTDGSSSQNGALSLPVQPNCGSPVSGDAVYRDTISGSSQACDLSVGDMVTVDSGQNTGPTKQGVTNRIASFEPWTNVATLDPVTLQATIVETQSPQLVVLPVVTDTAGQPVWHNGAAQQMVVVGFAWFVITGYSNGGKTVNGVFLAAGSSLQGGITGQWNPKTTTISAAALTA
jgi:Flp pilus assembly protein TadG